MQNSFAELLLTWFQQYGRKDLPWQQDKSPYRVWVSEIMLQQTQVKTVIPYYQRFMQRFPTIGDLAHADSDEVLHYWSGLGYYQRARHLHLAAKKIMHEFAGIFPRQLADIQSLPGIGKSTAGAILSIAGNIPTAILDGNVKRVLARVHGITDAINEKKVEAMLWQYAERYLPTKQSADYTQALMDLGATVCTRSQPKCSKCPVQTQCLAFKNNLTQLIPVKKITKILPVKSTIFMIVKAKHFVYLQKRAGKGVWRGLWSFPELPELCTKKVATYCLQHFNYQPTYQPLPSFRHTFSHYHLDIQPILLEIPKKPIKIAEANVFIWYNLLYPAALGLPQPVAKLLRDLHE